MSWIRRLLSGTKRRKIPEAASQTTVCGVHSTALHFITCIRMCLLSASARRECVRACGRQRAWRGGPRAARRMRRRAYTHLYGVFRYSLKKKSTRRGVGGAWLQVPVHRLVCLPPLDDVSGSSTGDSVCHTVSAGSDIPATFRDHVQGPRPGTTSWDPRAPRSPAPRAPRNAAQRSHGGRGGAGSGPRSPGGVKIVQAVQGERPRTAVAGRLS